MNDTKEKTKQIRQQFYQKECKKIFVCSVFEFCFVFYLFWCGISAKIFLLCLAVFCIGFLRMVFIGTRDFDWIFYNLYQERQDKIQIDFENPHTILPLGMRLGEMHLLSDSLIFRCRGKLCLVPLEEIDSLRIVKYRRAIFVYGQCMILVLQDMKKYKIEFLGKQQKQIPHITQWIKQKNPDTMIESRY